MLRTSKLLHRVVSGFRGSCRVFQALLDGPGVFHGRRRPRRPRFSPRLEALEDRTVPDAALGAGPALGGPAGRVVGNLYQVLLHRTPGTAEAAGWETALDNGLSPGEAAGRILAGPEYQAGLVRQGYQTLLGREPERAAVGPWLAVLQGPSGREQFTAAVLASAESYAAHGAGPVGWVTALYREVLDRAPEPAGLAAWLGAVDRGDSRESLARGFVDSPEAHAHAVADAYQSLLGRAPEAREGSGWAAALDAGLSRQRFLARVAASPEFLARLEADPGPAAPQNQSLSFLDPTFNAVEGQSFSGLVGTFFDPGSTAPASSYAATVQWGDGQSSAGTVSGAGGPAGFQVAGAHRYPAAGSYDVGISVTGPGGKTLLINHTTAVVADAPLAGRAVTYGARPGTYDDVVGYFTDPNPGARPGDFLATIDWGDGSTSAGLVAGQNGLYAVSGRHTYPAAGTYAVAARVLDAGGSVASWTSTLYVGTRPAGNAPLPADPTVSATEGLAFTGALVATFTDGDGNTDPTKYTPTISWGDGSPNTGGSVSYNSTTGQFQVTGGHTYTEEGSDTIQVQVSDSDGANFNITSTAQVADAALSVVSTSTPGATAHTAWSGQLLTFSDADPNAASGDYSATIAWGDGQSSAGTIGVSGSNFTVSGTHTYPHGGPFTIQVTVSDAGGASTSATLSPTVAGLNPSGANLTFTAGVSGGGTVATFSDTDNDQSSGDFTANVDWGDGTAPTSATVAAQYYNLQVQASHTYTRQGYYTITTTITDKVDGQTATVQSNANVSHATLSVNSQLGTSLIYGLTYSGQVAQFSDNDSDVQPNDFRSQVSWGDGTTSAGSMSYTGGYLVASGSHTYLAYGSYTVTTTVTDVPDGSTFTTSGSLTVNQQGPLYFTPATGLSATEGVAVSNLALGTFTDSDTNSSPSAYTATTIDWGDGTAASPAAVTGASPFTVAGGHTYAEAGTYVVHVNLQDSDGNSAVGAVSLTVGDAALTPTGRSLSATAGLPLNAATVATFTDGDPAAPVTDFTALVNWGDGTPVTAGAVTGSAGSYTVSGGHLYATANTFTATITITDADGQTATVTSTVTVTNSSASLTANAVSATEGASYSGTVGSFTPATGTSGDTFVASLGWGDGVVAYGTLTSNGLGGYNITGTHTYADETSANNPETLTITVLDQTSGSVAARATAAVTVADATLSATANALTAWTNQTTGLVAVATFTDPNTAAPASDFSASVTWGDGSSASAGTVLPTPGGSAGQFTVYAQHTWATANSFTVQTTVTDVGGKTAQVSGTATVAAATTSVSATEGASYSGVVGSFTGNPANALSASITWGDGTANGSGTIVSTGQNSFNVTTGGHTYADDGVYNLTVTVTMSGSGSLTDSGPAVVADASLSGTPNNLTAWVGQPVGMVLGQSDNPATLATFTDSNSGATAADFAGSTVNWGDGTTSTPTVVAGSPAGHFNVQANHTYVQPGSYTVTTSVVDKGGMATNLQGTATVGVREGQQYDAVFSLALPDPVTTAPPSSYTASIAWGDGTPNTTATTTPVYRYNNGQLTGSLMVTATHVYTGSGNFTVTASATDPNTSASSSGSMTLTVGDAPLNAIPQAVTAVAGSSTGTGTVAQFEDTNPSAAASQFTGVTINWGDNSGNLTGTMVATSTPGLFLVQGSHTYSAAGSYTITASATDTGGQGVTVTSTAAAVAAWTVLSGSGTRTTDPDRASLTPLGEAVVDLGQGAVRLSHPLDFDQSPGTSVGGSPALVYNSATVSPRPVVQLLLQSDPNTANPPATQYQVAWSFNGVNQTTQTFPVTSFQAGAVYLLAVQVGSAVTASGVYPWSATITITKQGGGTTTATASGFMPVVVRDNSAYGAGWGIDGIDQLVSIAANGSVPAGLLWVTGAGDARFFTQSGSSYTSPEDFGTLVQNGSNYLYTAKDQTQENFNSSGLLTSIVYPTGLTLSYAYTNGLLTGVTAPDGGHTTLSYDAHNFLYQVAEPGSGRTVALTQTEAQVGSAWQSTLTQVTDVDNTTRALGYDSLHHLTSDQYAPLYTSFTYDPSSGLLTGLTRGQSSPTVPYTIVSAASNGLSGTTTAVVWAKLTDGNNHTTQDLLDLRGRLVQQTDALGNNTYFQLNGAGDVTRAIDPLGRVTVNTYNSSEDLTQVTRADGSFVLFAYDPKFHEVTQTTNSLGETTSSAYDQTTGLQTSATDALGNTTELVWSSGRLQSTTDPLGHTTLYRYDGDLRQTAQIDSLGNWSQTGYDANGNPASTTDALGFVTWTVVNGRGLVTKTTDANGGVTQDTYYADGDPSGETNARGYTKTVTIDGRGLTTAATDYLGNATTEAYDAAGNRTSETDADGNTSTFQFDADNRPILRTTPLGEQTQTQYDAAGNVTETIDPNGGTTQNFVDLQDRPILRIDPLGHNQYTVLGPSGEDLADINAIGAVARTLFDAGERPILRIDPLGNTTQTRYDADANPVQFTDGRGYVTRTLFTGLNQQAAVIDPNGNTTRYVLNALGETTQTIDGNGHATNFAFDPIRRQISATDADGNRSQTVYGPAGGVLETIDPNGNPTVNTLDGDGRILRVKDPLGHVSTSAYDPAGNLVLWVDPNGKATSSQYNPDNAAVATTDPNGHTANTVFDKKGQVLTQFDGNQNGTFSGYDAAGQATGSGLATGASTTLAYNPLGQTAQENDPVNNATRVLYDLDGNVVGTLDPQGHGAFTSFNGDNQPIRRVDRNGRVVTSAYDPAGRLTSQVWVAANGSQVDALSYGYDHANNLTSAQDNTGTYSFVLDAANRPTRQTDPFGMILNFTEDANGNVTQVTDSAGATETSVYDADNQLTSRRLSGGPANSQLRIDVAYTPAGQVSQMIRYADTAGNTLLGKTQDSYDAAGNLTEVQHTNSSNSVLEDFQYTPDAANRLSSETDTISGTGATTNYSYDSSNQLTAAGSASYSFDANGNRTMSGYQVGANNQLLSDGTWNLTYDGEGNVIQKAGVAGGPDAGITWVFGYDNQNHLVSASKTSGGTVQLQVALSYDVFGNEVEEDVTQGGSTTVTRFAQQVAGLAPGWQGLSRNWADLNGSNQVLTRREYLDAAGAVFARVGSDGTEAWYLADHLGSVRGLMSNGGTLTDSLTLDPYGNVTSESSPSNGDRFKLAGGEYDGNLALYRFGARWSDPADGHWTSQDPLGLGPDSNPYRYVFNDPVGLIDPAGTDPGGRSTMAMMHSQASKFSVAWAYKWSWTQLQGPATMADGSWWAPIIENPGSLAHFGDTFASGESYDYAIGVAVREGNWTYQNFIKPVVLAPPGSNDGDLTREDAEKWALFGHPDAVYKGYHQVGTHFEIWADAALMMDGLRNLYEVGSNLWQAGRDLWQNLGEGFQTIINGGGSGALAPAVTVEGAGKLAGAVDAAGKISFGGAEVWTGWQDAQTIQMNANEPPSDPAPDSGGIGKDIERPVKRFSKQKLGQQIDEYNDLMKTYKKHLEKYGQQAGQTSGEVNRIERQLQEYRRILEGRGRRFGPNGEIIE